jgi:hypothetical protein
MAKMNTETALGELMATEGALGACLVDGESGAVLAAPSAGKSLDLALAAAGNADVVRAKMRTLRALAMNDSIEDILITLGRQYHLIRPLPGLSPGADGDCQFLYFVLDRGKCNLTMARHDLKAIAGLLTILRAPGPRRPRDSRLAAGAGCGHRPDAI